MQYETEEQQVEALRAWWNENGKAVIAGIVIGVLIVGAWMWWKTQQENKAIAASNNFSQSMEALEAGDLDTVQKLSAEKGEHSDSLYGAYTALAAARAAIDKGDLEGAATELQWAVDNAKLEDVSILARSRLARVKVAMGDAAGALSALPATYPDVYAHLIEEARGDAHVAAGDNAAARAAYQLAIDTGRAADRDALEMKFNELATVGGGS